MKLSQELSSLKQVAQTNSLSVNTVLESLHTKGPALLIVVITLPFLQPIPMMGLSAPFGMIISLLGLAMLLGREPWIPQRFRKLEMSPELAKKSLEVAESISLKIERFVKPRWNWMNSSSWAQRLTGFLIALNGFLLALPLPIPASNAVPAWTLLALALSLIEEDGALQAIGFFMSLLCIGFFVILGLLPYYGMTLFK
jgi:hypothetical protein